MEHLLSEVARVNVDAALKLQNPLLTQSRRKELHIEALKAYIKSKPAGQRITTEEFMHALHFNGQAACWHFIETCVSKGIISKEPITPRTFSYTVLGEDKVTKPAALPVVVDLGETINEHHHRETLANGTTTLVGYREYSIAQLEELAGRFMYHYDSTNIKDFIKWLNSQEN